MKRLLHIAITAIAVASATGLQAIRTLTTPKRIFTDVRCQSLYGCHDASGKYLPASATTAGSACYCKSGVMYEKE